jgi:molybdopterin-biosynthesis enzyme MoeA-like protein
MNITARTACPPIGLIIIGDEILSGKRQDGHFAKVRELLAARGLGLAWVRYLGDDRALCEAALRESLATNHIVFSCGGIGATPDDHTRQCAAAALGRELALHTRAAELIRERMRDVALEQGLPFEPDRPDNVHRLNMGMFPAEIIPNPYNKIAGFSCQHVHFFPGFPVMAWPMMEWVLDTKYAHLHRPVQLQERSVIVMGAMEASLTPLMEEVESSHVGVKVFSLPSVDHPQYGKHIELGVKGDVARLDLAYAQLLDGLRRFGAQLGPELAR